MFTAGQHADALLAAEYVCRRLPMNRIPAILRAKILQTAYPFMASRAWHAAWLSEAENPLLRVRNNTAASSSWPQAAPMNHHIPVGIPPTPEGVVPGGA